MVLELQSSRTFPVGVEQAFDVLLHSPLPEVFSRRYAAIPPVREVRDQEGAWGSVGQTRTIQLADGGTMQETFTSLDRPSSFGYRISDISGPMKPLVDRLDGRWGFVPAGTGVRITWAWTVQPRTGVGTAAMPVFARMWQGYARQAMEQIEGLLVR
jgi:Polyketide cyclase / dehydrase and lipid transport